MTKERKQELIKAYRINEGDTGSPEVQIALLTEEINDLNKHLSVHSMIFILKEAYFKNWKT